MAAQNTNQNAASKSRGTTLLKWTAAEYEYHEKGPVWRLLAIIAIMGLILYGIIADSYAFSFVIALFAGVYFITHKPPRNVEVKVTDMGIVVDDRFYEYSNMRHFWILLRSDDVATFNVRLIKNLVKELSIFMGDQDPAELREVVSRFIPEITGKEEHFSDWLTRKLKL